MEAKLGKSFKTIWATLSNDDAKENQTSTVDSAVKLRVQGTRVGTARGVPTECQTWINEDKECTQGSGHLATGCFIYFNRKVLETNESREQLLKETSRKKN